MMERPSGGFNWSVTHSSPYELNKLAMMNYPCSILDVPPSDLTLSRTNLDGSVTSQSINTASTYKYLGVTLDPKLRWASHHQRVIAKATWWSLQVARLSRISGGMPPNRIHQLYNTVAIPALSYAADVWYSGIHHSPSGNKRLGSVALTKKLTSIQRRVAQTITGSLSTTAGDVLNAHANLLPVDLLFNKILFHAATHLASLPPSHPLYPLICKAASRHVKKHRSPLHDLFFTMRINPNKVEKVQPTRRRPNYIPSFSTHITDTKQEALDAAIEYHRSPISVYSDGSGFENGIGAAAVLYINKIERKTLNTTLGPLPNTWSTKLN